MSTTETSYLPKSERLGFRAWSQNDFEQFAKLNADPFVMKHFPNPLTKKETEEFIQRFMNHYDKHGYCYFATEMLETGEFIGYIGLAYQSYETEFTPATDIGWRLKKSAWGNGYATEGATLCLKYAFEELNLDRVISTCTIKNTISERVMKKIGMKRMGEFNHPKLKAYPEFQRCIWYEKMNMVNSPT